VINITKEHDFILGDVQVYPSRNQIAVHGKTLALQPQVMAVLAYLAHNHERVVSSEELMEQLWKGRIVTPGSVQKSINSLRKALAEFLGNQEVVTHYSKRGYQLVLPPVFVPLEHTDTASVSESRPAARYIRTSVALGFALICIAVISLFFLNPASQAPTLEPKNHKSRFNASSEYTRASGHVRDAEPHPDNKHVAYIREQLISGTRWEINSELMIRNEKGDDWQIASSQGSWVSLAWSPTGQNLVAIEIWRQEGLPPTPNFYERENFLYTFHVFSLDLDNHRLLEKHRLSQWQGRINSVTWWDDSTLEFVAAQGPDANFERYRYTTDTQQLTIVEPLKALGKPLSSAVMHQRTALVSAEKKGVKINLIDENQIAQADWLFDYPCVDVSWIPDGTGVLVYAEEQQKLFALYWNGQRQEISFQSKFASPVSRPRYRPDGSAIYYTEEKLRSVIWLKSIDGQQRQLTEASNLNYSAVFSPKGDQIVYASVRDNQLRLWLQEQGEERELTQPLDQPVSRIIWTADAEYLVYKVGRQIIFHHLTNATQETLRLESNVIEPFAFDAKNKLLFVTKLTGESNNIWSIQTDTLQQKQLTFGAVGSAIEYADDIYFQYRGKSGLWVLRGSNFHVERVIDTLDENSQLLAVDSDGIYFITGGQCRESDIYFLDFNGGKKSVFLARNKKIMSTHSFHPKSGLLQQDCALTESNIFIFQ
jgi:DNA-binding winged helix-turn-helix (wHTH) protein/WD40 repeat protein